MEKEILFEDNSNRIWISYYDDSTIYNAETKQEIPTISRTIAELLDINNNCVYIKTAENIIIIPIHRVLKIKKSIKKV